MIRDITDKLRNPPFGTQTRMVAADTIEALRDDNARLTEELAVAFCRVERLCDALEIFVRHGCPVCGGDCASANPPVAQCPMQSALSALKGIKDA